MDNNLEIIKESEILYLRDKESNTVIARQKPFGSKFTEYKRIGINCNIIREEQKNFPLDKDGGLANIYCLDDNFQIKWMIQDNSGFPNQIQWNKKIREVKGSDGVIAIERIDSHTSFICASWDGFTITVDYQTGQTISSVFTK